MKKKFVLDTNVLLHSADSIFSFDDNDVVIPMPVIEELDRFKSRNDELGRNARMVVRNLDGLRNKGTLSKGVPTKSGGCLMVLPAKKSSHETGLDPTITDNKIVEMAFSLHKKGSGVVFVSKDINARLKADSLGLRVRDFEKQKINFDELFSGYREAPVSGDIIDSFYKETEFTIDNLGAFPNEFVMLKNQSNLKQTALAIAKDSDTLLHLNPSFESAWNIKPLNREQRIALELLLDTSINIVTLVGQAGSGKTLLALAAALETSHRHKQYDKILVTRPIVPMGKDIGYLPGDKEEKLTHWMQPIFDNLAYLMRGEKSSYEKEVHSVQFKVDRLLKNHVVEMEALTYIRGRSIPKQYVIVDEAQNLTPHEIKTIISRAGEGTKMVLTGDPYQIDNPYLDSNSNGLAYAVDRLKNHPIHGHITLKRSERSKLAAIAADLL